MSGGTQPSVFQVSLSGEGEDLLKGDFRAKKRARSRARHGWHAGRAEQLSLRGHTPPSQRHGTGARGWARPEFAAPPALAGQFLIRPRPSAQSLGGGDARIGQLELIVRVRPDITTSDMSIRSSEGSSGPLPRRPFKYSGRSLPWPAWVLRPWACSEGTLAAAGCVGGP